MTSPEQEEDDTPLAVTRIWLAARDLVGDARVRAQLREIAKAPTRSDLFDDEQYVAGDALDTLERAVDKWGGTWDHRVAHESRRFCHYLTGNGFPTPPHPQVVSLPLLRKLRDAVYAVEWDYRLEEDDPNHCDPANALAALIKLDGPVGAHDLAELSWPPGALEIRAEANLGSLNPDDDVSSLGTQATMIAYVDLLQSAKQAAKRAPDESGTFAGNIFEGDVFGGPGEDLTEPQ